MYIYTIFRSLFALRIAQIGWTRKKAARYFKNYTPCQISGFSVYGSQLNNVKDQRAMYNW
jgi:hypothetical protein